MNHDNNLDFFIYNIPQLAGVSLTISLLREMLKNPNVIGVKNSSMPVQDIQMFKIEGGEECVVFNGPDEQLVGGLVMGAAGGIGGTYGVMPEAYLKIYELVKENKMQEAYAIQVEANKIIAKMCECSGNLYAVMKEIIKRRENLNLGGVRSPLANLSQDDETNINIAKNMIDQLILNL